MLLSTAMSVHTSFEVRVLGVTVEVFYITIIPLATPIFLQYTIPELSKV